MLGHMGSILGPCWVIWSHVGPMLGYLVGCMGLHGGLLGGKKPPNERFLCWGFFFSMLRAMWGQFGSCWACWAYVGPKVTHQTSEIVQKRVKTTGWGHFLFGAYGGPYGVHVGPMLCYLEPCWAMLGLCTGKLIPNRKLFGWELILAILKAMYGYVGPMLGQPFELDFGEGRKLPHDQHFLKKMRVLCQMVSFSLFCARHTYAWLSHSASKRRRARHRDVLFFGGADEKATDARSHQRVLFSFSGWHFQSRYPGAFFWQMHFFHQQPSLCESFEHAGVLSEFWVDTFCVHTYAVPSFEPLLGVRLTTASERKHFSTSKMPTKASKAKAAKPVRLPLGLTESPRKRKRGKPMAGQGSTVKKARATTTTKGSSGRDNSSIGVVREIDPDIAALLAGQNQEPSSEEDSDLDSTDSDNHSDSDSSDSSDSSADLAGDDLAEQPFLTPEAAEEERQISLVTQSHCQLMELRGEPVHLQASVPDNSGLDEVKALAKAGKTFCNQVVGLVELGVQANNRLATCRHCNTKIACGGVRFGYSYNVRKFHAWVHAGCIVSYLSEQKANIQQAFEFLEDMETKDYPANVKTEICNVKRGLKSLAGWALRCSKAVILLGDLLDSLWGTVMPDTPDAWTKRRLGTSCDPINPSNLWDKLGPSDFWFWPLTSEFPIK